MSRIGFADGTNGFLRIKFGEGFADVVKEVRPSTLEVVFQNGKTEDDLTVDMKVILDSMIGGFPMDYKDR